MTNNPIHYNIDDYSANLRKKTKLPYNKFLVTNLTGSKQEKDISLGTNCNGLGRIHHFKSSSDDNWIPNPLPHHVAAWKMGISPKNEELVQVFQLAACNCKCWYCFVDRDLLIANKKNAEFKTADDLLELFLIEEEKPYIIDISGGQPDITPEWSVHIMKAFIFRNLQNKYYLWQDDNLTLYYPWNYLNSKDFNLIKNYKNYGRVGCFKGFSPESFHENTSIHPDLLLRQIDIMSKWVNEGIDIYGYITLTTSNLDNMKKKLRIFMDSIQDKIHPNFLLRIIPLKISIFSPFKNELKGWQKRALSNQFDVLSAWKEEIENRYSKKEQDNPIYLVNIH